MKLPLIILAKDDRSIEICISTDYLETIMETYDVEDGLYDVFDAEGMKYPVSVRTERRRVTFFFGLIKGYESRPAVCVNLDEGCDAINELRSALIFHLTEYINLEVGYNELPLEDLIHLVDQFQRGNVVR